jgi:GH24 family phage-related lysozyme (muramidase)
MNDTEPRCSRPFTDETICAGAIVANVQMVASVAGNVKTAKTAHACDLRGLNHSVHRCEFLGCNTVWIDATDPDVSIR